MAVGIITGSGNYGLPALEVEGANPVATPHGEVDLTLGRWAGVDVVHLSRHGPGHARLSNHVNHRANMWALKEAGVSAVVGCTACGALDPDISLGTVIVFDDLHFLVNRLPDGSLCTYFDTPGDAQRGHWIIVNEGPYAPALRELLLEAAGEAGVAHRDGGAYGQVDGPRFNTPAEIRTLRMAGVVAVSQTGGPEATLAGELELPYALMGFATDHANGISAHATPVAELIRLMGESSGRFGAILEVALPRIAAAELTPPGSVYRFEG